MSRWLALVIAVVFIGAGCQGSKETAHPKLFSPMPTSRSAVAAPVTAALTRTTAPAATLSPTPTPAITPTTTATPQPTIASTPSPTPQAPSPTPTPTLTPSPTLTNTPPLPTEAAELAAICSFNVPQRRFLCHAEGQGDGQLRWTTDLGLGSGGAITYERTLPWGKFIDEINVQLEECQGLTCSLATTTIDVELQPRGDCPDDFTGWFTTFLIDDISLIVQVGQPGQIRSNDYKPHGYIRVPNGRSDIEVRLPIDATLFAGSQSTLFFATPCEGLWFYLGDIAVPIPEIEALLPQVGDGGTSPIGPLAMREGDVIGTGIGTSENAYLDFGVIDQRPRLLTYRHPEAISYEPYAVCFYDFFGPEIASTLRSLIIGESTDSDFCQ